MHEVCVGVIDGDQFGEGTPGREAGLELAITHLLVAGHALRASTASADKRNGYPVAASKVADICADLLDDTCKFMARNVGQGDVGVVSHPSVPVAAADPAGLYSDDGALVRGYGIRYVSDLKRLLKLFVDRCFHRGYRRDYNSSETALPVMVLHFFTRRLRKNIRPNRQTARHIHESESWKINIQEVPKCH